MDNQLEVFSPWAEVDAVSLKGLTTRLDDLDGKTIGLFVNHKPASPGVQAVVERKLKEKFPALKLSIYRRYQPDSPKVLEDEAKFREWVKGVDAVILGQGD
jgi:hypothetical protein